GGLDSARRPVANARPRGHGLWNDATELREIDGARHLARITKGAGRDEDRVLQAQSAEGNGKIHATGSGGGEGFLAEDEAQLTQLALGQNFPGFRNPKKETQKSVLQSRLNLNAA